MSVITLSRSKLTKRSSARAAPSTDAERHFEHEQVTSPVPLAHPTVQRWIGQSVKKGDDACEYNYLC